MNEDRNNIKVIKLNTKPDIKEKKDENIESIINKYINKEINSDSKRNKKKKSPRISIKSKQLIKSKNNSGKAKKSLELSNNKKKKVVKPESDKIAKVESNKIAKEKSEKLAKGLANLNQYLNKTQKKKKKKLKKSFQSPKKYFYDKKIKMDDKYNYFKIYPIIEDNRLVGDGEIIGENIKNIKSGILLNKFKISKAYNETPEIDKNYYSIRLSNITDYTHIDNMNLDLKKKNLSKNLEILKNNHLLRII